MRHATLLLVALSALAPAVAAQDTLQIEPGERVRLTLESGRITVGVLVTQDRDSLRIRPRPDAPPVAFSRHGIAGVDASLGRHGHAGTGALVGLVAGGVAGAAPGGELLGRLPLPRRGRCSLAARRNRSPVRRPGRRLRPQRAVGVGLPRSGRSHGPEDRAQVRRRGIDRILTRQSLAQRPVTLTAIQSSARRRIQVPKYHRTSAVAFVPKA